MIRHLLPIVLIFLLLSWQGSPGRSQEPAAPVPEGEVLAVPQTVAPPLNLLQPAPQLMPQGYYPPVFPVIPPQPPRLGTRETWQYMGVDQFGKWRPKVILAPYGSYYYYNGQPYPWITTRPTHYMPYVLD